MTDKSINASLIAMVLSFIAYYGILYYAKPSWVMHTDKTGKTVLRQDKLLLWSGLGSLVTAVIVATLYPTDKKGSSAPLARSGSLAMKYNMGSCGAGGMGYGMKYNMGCGSKGYGMKYNMGCGTKGYGMKYAMGCGCAMKTPYGMRNGADNAMLL